MCTDCNNISEGLRRCKECDAWTCKDCSFWCTRCPKNRKYLICGHCNSSNRYLTKRKKIWTCQVCVATQLSEMDLHRRVSLLSAAGTPSLHSSVTPSLSFNAPFIKRQKGIGRNKKNFIAHENRLEWCLEGRFVMILDPGRESRLRWCLESCF